MARLLIAMTLILAAGSGCVQRTLRIDSDPPGALVYLNGQEAGRTPMRKNFIWYGTYDVQLRKEGYQTISRKEKVWAPWWQWPPIDLVMDLFPLQDTHTVSYAMRPAVDEPNDTKDLLTRGQAMKSQLATSHEKSTREKQQEAMKPATKP